jgi:hypothetical protein
LSQKAREVRGFKREREKDYPPSYISYRCKSWWWSL